jgi:hypothetical protein
MRNRLEFVTRLVCAALAVLLLVQFARVFLRQAPIAQLQIPPLPTLDSAANQADTAASPAKAKVGNAPTTRAAAASAGTNAANTNIAAISPGTNGTAGATGTNAVAASAITNAEDAVVSGTNTVTSTNAAKLASVSTNAPTGASTNKTAALSSTNLPSDTAKAKTNPPPGSEMAGKKNNSGPGSGPSSSGPRTKTARPPKEAAPEVLAQVDRITESEILAPVIRPLPMALLGIAGNTVFLRAPNGQTGLVKEGDELGGLKLLRIGTNRVLVEKEGKKEELMIFSGFGGDSLLPQ